eukprot:271552_1
MNLLGEIRDPNDEICIEMEESNSEPDEEEVFLDQTQREFDELGILINNIITNTKATMSLEKKAKSETTQSQHKECMAKLDTLISSTMAYAKAVSDKIKIYKQKNDEYEAAHPHSTLSQWRINKLNTSALRFQKALQAFNSASDSFKDSLRTKIARQARLVNQDITAEQIEEIVESSDPTAFMQQALMIPDAMIDRVADIEKRHQGILNIEKGVKELQELWGQLAVLIDDQQEELDHIESNVEQTLNYVQKGKQNLAKARKNQQNARKTACCTILIICVIALILVFVVFK